MSKNTYTVFPEDTNPASALSSDQLTEAVYRIAHQLEKSEKKRKKLEKAVDKLLKPGKKKKKSGKGKGKKHKKGKGDKNKKSDWVDDIIRESTSTALKITEMYAQSKFFPDGHKNSKQ